MECSRIEVERSQERHAEGRGYLSCRLYVQLHVLMATRAVKSQSAMKGSASVIPTSSSDVSKTDTSRSPGSFRSCSGIVKKGIFSSKDSNDNLSGSEPGVMRCNVLPSFFARLRWFWNCYKKR